jgi:hypothetical protein
VNCVKYSLIEEFNVVNIVHGAEHSSYD